MSAVPTKTSSTPSGRLRSWVSRIHWSLIVTAIAGAVLFYFLSIVVPRISLLWGYSGLKALLYEDLGIRSDAWASFLALIGSFIYAVLWLPLIVLMFSVVAGRFNLRRATWAFVWFIVIYGHAPFLRAMYGADVCFNQRTGAPLKWFVIGPSGAILLYDSPGFDSSLGVQKRPVTNQICRILEAQKRGIRPRAIAGNAENVNFFDEVTGQPRVWYAKTTDGRIDLFDAEGTHPSLGIPLLPITIGVIDELRILAAKEKILAESLARGERERATAEVQRKTRQELADLFGTIGYHDGVVILGIGTLQSDELSKQTATQLLAVLSAAIRKKGLPVDEFRPKVYSAGHFNSLLNGNVSLLNDAGLSRKMRAALIGAVETTCHPASAAAGVTSCSISLELRVVGATGLAKSQRWTGTGAGSDVKQAITRASEIIVERHSELLDGV